MNLQETMKTLDAAGSPTHRKIYPRHGITGPMFGVPYSFLKPFVKKLGCDHGLAKQLWASGNYDARIVATMIADPAQTDAALIERWLKDATNSPLNDALACLAAVTNIPLAHIDRWCAAKDEWTSTLGWGVAARHIGQGDWSDEDLKRRLETLERSIHKAPNRTRHVMNNAVIAIGARGGALQAAAIAAAKRIGAVQVDHGETGCRTPDAAEYILKVAAHRGKQPAKARSKREKVKR